MTNLKIWYVLAAVIVLVVSFEGYFVSKYADIDTLYVGRHAQTNPYWRRKRIVVSLKGAVVVSVIVGLVMPAVLDFDGFIRYGSRFTTTYVGSSDPLAGGIVYVLYMISYSLVAAGAYYLGKALYNRVHYRKHAEPNDSNEEPTSHPSVRYVDGSNYHRPSDNNSGVELDMDQATKIFKEGSARLKNHKGFQHEAGNAARDHLYDTAGIDRSELDMTPLERFNKACGIID